MNPTLRCGQSYLNPGLIWLHTYLHTRLTVTQTQRMDLLIADSVPKSKASLSSNRAEHDDTKSETSLHLPSDYISYTASGAYRAAWGALGYLFLRNSIRE